MGQDDEAPPTITLNPMPPTRGARMTVTFSPGGTVLLDWTPAGTPTSVKCDQNGNAVVVVPANASYLIASDANGAASPVGTTIS